MTPDPLMPDPDSRLNDIALHQIKRQTTDANVTFIGGVVSTGMDVVDDGRTFQPTLSLWIARHSVIPDQPQVRSIGVADPAHASVALLNGLVESILPQSNPNLSPLLPGRIEVADDATVALLREALKGVNTEIVVAQDMGLIQTLADSLASDLRRQLTPIGPWEAPVEVVRDLAAAAANLYRRDPWQSLGDSPPITITLDRYGIGTLYLAMTYGNEDTEGVIAYFSTEAYHRAGKVDFLMEKLEDAGGEMVNLDLPQADLDLLEEVIRYPEHGLGEAVTVFFEAAEDLSDDARREVREMNLPMASRQAVPIFTRVSATADPRRPNEDEARALRLALEAFNQFYVRQHERIDDEAWHFGPITATVQVKQGGEKIPVKLSITSPAPTLPTSLRQAVLLVRVMLEGEPTVWREIEIEASQPLWEMDRIIHEAFGWPSRAGSFLPRDEYDGEETYESRLLEDLVTSEQAPIGLLMQKPRDFAHYMFDVTDKAVSHRLRLLSLLAKKEPGVEYPRVVRTHGDTPPIYSAEDYETIDLDDLDDDDFDDDEDD
ncbi:MAG: hypothetical protein H0X24_23400 [Ktedonobacterales bacterium]|nr:hypothetical protein [Ktedonobacterales bacterium]